MSYYRNINVDGVDYKYVVGAYYVKIRGVGAWPKDKIGDVIDDLDWGDTYTVNVRPEHIAAKIRETVQIKG